MSQFFTQVSEKAAELAGHYAAFILATLFIVVWGISGPFFDFSDTAAGDKHIDHDHHFSDGVSYPKFAGPRSQRHPAKLDEILNLVSKTRSETIGAEHLPLDKLKLILKHLEQEGEKRATAAAVQEENE